MKIIINRVCLIAAISAISTGCGAAINPQSEALEVEEGIDIQKNPLTAIQKLIELGTEANDDNVANRESVKPVSFRELINYLPQVPQGWQALEPEGETNSFGSYGISQASQVYTQGNKKMEVSIFDWALNSALYTPFLLSTEFSQESTAGYNKGIKINDMPGREEYTYRDKKGSLNLLVNNRFLVRIDGKNIEDLELREWWQLMDYKSLTEISFKQSRE